MISDDTIVAISSAVGPAARMIVRMSGHDAFRIVSSFIDTAPALAPGSATRVSLRFDDLEFPSTLYCFCTPHSVTGEDVVEIHLPGNPLLARIVLDASIRAGGRAAAAGEFTSRSYFNGRIDLSAAEGVSAVIAAQSDRELDAARRLLSGELSRRLRPTMDALAQTLALTEADIDFSEEEISQLNVEKTREQIGRINAALVTLLGESVRFETLSHEPVIVLVGRPNAGKSTLFNVLAGVDRAIISSVAGTTRDALSATVMLRRGIVKLMDVAGVDESASSNELDQQMRVASLRVVETADVVVLVREIGDELPEVLLPVKPHLRIRSKADLCIPVSDDLQISAHSSIGISDLLARLDSLAFGETASNPSLSLNARHIQSIEDARSALHRAATASELELIAFDLREALDALGSILGSITPDDVLGRIFSTFCIGK